MQYLYVVLFILGLMLAAFLFYILILLYQALTIYIKKNKEEEKYIAKGEITKDELEEIERNLE
jgi:hypothetical protein